MFVPFCALLLTASACCIRGAVPEDLTNYQNVFECDASTRLVRPLDVEDIKQTVVLHDEVMAVGAGHSFDAPFFCAGPSAEGKTSANVVLTTVRPLLILVDEDERTAWVSAGVTVWDLVDYLSNYVTASAPRGYSLRTQSAYLNQTIGGAVATGTHGQSMRHGSLSNQVAAFRLVLANGTVTEISRNSHPFLFRALQVNVGRLGIVMDLKMRIVPEGLVERVRFVDLPLEQVAGDLQRAGEVYSKTGELPSPFNEVLMLVLNPVNFTFLMWTLAEAPDDYAPSNTDLLQIIRESKSNLDAATERINAPLGIERRQEGRTIAEGVDWVLPDPVPKYVDRLHPDSIPDAVEFSEAVYAAFVNSGTFETSIASPSWPVSLDPLTLLYTDYEVAVSIEKAAECLWGLIDFIKREAPDYGLRDSILFRGVGKEEGLLSVSYDGPAVYFSVLDYVAINLEPYTINEAHQRLVAYLVTDAACAPGRLHWGKAGFPDPGCYNGVDYYGVNWCHFGCAVRALDPTGKFAGLGADRWNWQGAELDACCTGDGYDTSKPGCDCSVIPIRRAEECPPPPFYD